MDSNGHGIMEQNEEHLEVNISIYYTDGTEQYARSYDAMNRAIICENFGTWQKMRGEKSTSRDLGFGGHGRRGSSSPELEDGRPE